MIELSQLVQAVGPVAGTAFLAFLRIGAIMALIPAFGEQMIPMRVRLGLAIGATVMTLPLVGVTDADAPASYARAGVLEVATGLAFGLALRTFLLALQTAATMISQATSLSHIFGGQAMDPQPAIGHLLAIGGLCLAVILDLHVALVRMLAGTYLLVPMGAGLDMEGARVLGPSRVAEAFAMAFSLAAPFLIFGTIYNIALGVINRAMPQLMVAFVGAPALVGGGLALMATVAPYVVGIWAMRFQEFVGSLGGP